MKLEIAYLKSLVGFLDGLALPPGLVTSTVFPYLDIKINQIISSNFNVMHLLMFRRNFVLKSFPKSVQSKW